MWLPFTHAVAVGPFTITVSPTPHGRRQLVAGFPKSVLDFEVEVLQPVELLSYIPSMAYWHYLGVVASSVASGDVQSGHSMGSVVPVRAANNEPYGSILTCRSRDASNSGPSPRLEARHSIPF